MHILWAPIYNFFPLPNGGEMEVAISSSALECLQSLLYLMHKSVAKINKNCIWELTGGGEWVENCVGGWRPGRFLGGGRGKWKKYAISSTKRRRAEELNRKQRRAMILCAQTSGIRAAGESSKAPPFPSAGRWQMNHTINIIRIVYLHWGKKTYRL